jgi:hypothetical protein
VDAYFYVLGHLKGFLELFIGKSRLFENRIEKELKKVQTDDVLRLTDLKTAADNTKSYFIRLLSSSDLRLRELESVRETLKENPQELLDTRRLMEAFAKSSDIKVTFSMDKFAAAMELLELSSHLPDIFTLLERVNFDNLQGEPWRHDSLFELYENKLSKEEHLYNITFGDVQNILNQAKTALVGLDIVVLRLFKEITNAERFLYFIKRFRFYGPGKENFTTTFGLVTNNLQGQAYDSNLLIHLKEAHELVCPFFEATNLKGIFTDLKKFELDTKSAKHLAACLRNVHSNMDTIETWFEQRLESSIIMYAKTAIDMLNTGVYLFVLDSRGGDADHVAPTRERPALFIEYLRSDGKLLKPQKMAAKEVSELVRMLIFFHRGSGDKKEESKGDNEDRATKKLIQVHSELTRAFEVIAQLKEAGHPSYQSQKFTGQLSSLSVRYLEWQRELADWGENLNTFLQEYPFLRFLSVHQLHFAVKLLAQLFAVEDESRRWELSKKLHHIVMLIPRLSNLSYPQLTTALQGPFR